MYQILQKFDIHWHGGGPSIAMMYHLRRVSDLLYDWKSCLLCYQKDFVLHCSIFFKWNKSVRVRVQIITRLRPKAVMASARFPVTISARQHSIRIMTLRFLPCRWCNLIPRGEGLAGIPLLRIWYCHHKFQGFLLVSSGSVSRSREQWQVVYGINSQGIIDVDPKMPFLSWDLLRFVAARATFFSYGSQWKSSHPVHCEQFEVLVHWGLLHGGGKQHTSWKSSYPWFSIPLPPPNFFLPTTFSPIFFRVESYLHKCLFVTHKSCDWKILSFFPFAQYIVSCGWVVSFLLICILFAYVFWRETRSVDSLTARDPDVDETHHPGPASR